MNLGNLLSTSASRNPHKAALIFGEQTVSYEQFDRITTSLAGWFIEQGCQTGDRIALHWPNSVDMAMLLFACFKAGLIAVPVNASMKAPEIAYVLEHSRAVTYMVHPDLASGILDNTRGCTSLQSIRSSLEDGKQRESSLGLPSVGEDDLALILYTSGTTARPKGVTHSHKTMLEMIRLMHKIVPNNVEAALLMTQMSYITAVGGLLLPAIANGLTTVVAPGFDASFVLDLIERFHCGYLIGLPSMAQHLLEEQLANPRDVSPVRTFIVAGDSVPTTTQEHFRFVFHVPLREAHGMTETGPTIANPPEGIRPGSLGKVIDTVEVRIVDDRGRSMREGQTGEIILRTPACFVGYWEDPQATSETIRDGWLYTGDLGHRDRDGYIWFDGRKKEVIVRGGYNISPQEVEEVICSHPAVLESAVIGQPAPVYGERVIAYVALRDGLLTDEKELRNFASQRLTENKVPENIVFLNALPKGITGKIQRRTLKEMAASLAGVPTSSTAIAMGTTSQP